MRGNNADESDAIEFDAWGEPDPPKGTVPTEEERGVLPPEFENPELMSEPPPGAVDIDALPTSGGFRPAVVASVKPPAPSSAPAPPSSFPPDVDPGFDELARQAEEAAKTDEPAVSRSVVIAGVGVLVVALIAIIVAQVI